MCGKVIKGGKVFGYLVKDNEANELLVVEHDDIYEFKFDNATVTKDGRVRGKKLEYMYSSSYEKIPAYDYDYIYSESRRLILYHGAEYDLHDRVSNLSSLSRCSFGNGFYTTKDRLQAINRVKNIHTPLLYTMILDTKDLDVYEITDSLYWAIYVGINRCNIDMNKYPKLNDLYNRINSHDVIVGNIPDEKTAEPMIKFFRGELTINAFRKSLNSIELPTQYVLKTQKAYDNLRILYRKDIGSDDIYKCNQVSRDSRLKAMEVTEKIRREIRKGDDMGLKDYLEKYYS
jgi:hypothetical protein